MFVKTLLILLLFLCLISAEPLQLTDKTWKNMLHGQWMVEFYAPWCRACQQFKPVWNDFSTAMSNKNIKVAAIDTDQYPSLSRRFRIAALPTVYYVRDGVFRQFNGERSLKVLKNYIEYEDWQTTEPVSSYLAPDSILMSLTGSGVDVPVFVKEAFTLLQDHYGFPTWFICTIFALAVIIIGIVLAFGIGLIFDDCAAGLSKFYTKPVTLDENDSEKLLKSNEQTVTTPTSVVDNENDNLKEGSDQEEAQTTNDPTIRQRRLQT